MTTSTRALAALTAGVLTLGLTACGGDDDKDPPAAQSYASMAEWKGAVEGTGLGCQWDSDIRFPTNVDEYAHCTDADGAEADLYTFTTETAKYNRISKFRNSTSWANEVPAMVDGPGWTVECENEDQAQRWIDELGGQLRLAPNY